MVLNSTHETRDTRQETIRYDSVCVVMCFRVITDYFDYNL